MTPVGGLGRRVAEAGAAEREVLQREPQRLGVRELPLEQVQARQERGELVVGELELRQEVVLGAERVELLAGELVPLRVERDAERDQLGPVGVEAPREGLVGHLRVALDVALHVACRQRPALRHQEGDERELPDQLVGVVRQGGELTRSYARWGLGREAGALEVLVRRAVVALGQRRPLAGLALARRRAAAGDAAVERAGLELLLDEADRRADAFAAPPRRPAPAP